MATRKVAVVKITTSSSLNAIGESVGVIVRSMSKKLLASSEITPLLETAEKDLSHLANTNKDNRDLKDEFVSSTRQLASTYSFTSNTAPVMAIKGLIKYVQEQDSQITKLINKVDNADVSRVMGKQVQVHNEVETSKKQQSSEKKKLIPVDQLKEFIMRTIKDKFDGSFKSSLTYMSIRYQPSQFHQFDGKGNSKQHVAHFIKACNVSGTYGDYLTDLEANSINSWEQLKQEFLNRFYSIRQTVSMIELTNSRQWKEEHASAIEMCIQEIHWGLQYILQRIQPRMFEELATRTHDMELSMAASGVEGPPIQESQMSKERYKAKKGGKSFSKAPSNANDMSGEKKDTSQEKGQRKLTLIEMQAKQYPFLDFDIFGIFDDLLKANLIELPKIKCPEEAGRVDNLKYYKYYRLVGHPIHDCFIFKDKVMQLARQ
ncbi:hypothetical protein Pfo_020418 [Paulownia fortunei]|nr:hypothetical protein Pfo_020418 [Paulownia fortunei]